MRVIANLDQSTPSRFGRSGAIGAAMAGEVPGINRLLRSIVGAALMVAYAGAQTTVTVETITGSGVQAGNAVAMDAQGNSYIAGFTDSQILTIPGLATPPSCPGGTDVLLVKFGAGTTTPLWARCLGGTWYDRANAVAVGPDGSIYIAGVTNSPDFPAANNGKQASAGGLDGFVMKLSADGRSVIWSQLIGGKSNDSVNALYVSSSGDIYAGGETQSSDLPVTNALLPRLNGYQNGFLARISPSGSVRYCTYIGGNGHDRVLAVGADSQGNAYAAGSTDSTNFPAVNALTAVRPGPTVGFVLKLRADGGQVLFSTYIGGSSGMQNGEQVNAIAVSQAGIVYLGGVTSSADFPVANAYQSAFRGWNTDAFLAALSADGSARLFSTFLGGSQGDSITGLTLNEAAGILSAVGPTMSTDFPGLSSPASSFMVQFSTSGQYQRTVTGLGSGLNAAAVAAGSPGFVLTGAQQQAGSEFAFMAQVVIPPMPSHGLIWMADSTRQVKEWYMGGAQSNTVVGVAWLNQSGMPGWRVAAVADMNRDGVPDLIWQNDTTRQVLVVYMAQDNTSTGSNWINQAGAPGWKVVAAGDLNRDGVPDIIWQNDTTRQVTVWYMGGAGGAVNLSWSWINQAGAPGWRVAALADLNQDGVPDIIWQNDATRQVTVWYMGGAGGAVNLYWSWINQAGAPGWTVSGSADLNQDGVPDIIWQNDATRQVTAWYMGGPAGSTNLSWSWLDSTGQAGWTVVAAR